MKCPKIVPAMLHNGEVKRPERPCDDELQILEPGVGSCPFHGLVEIVEDPETNHVEEWQQYLERKAFPNGRPEKKWWQRG